MFGSRFASFPRSMRARLLAAATVMAIGIMAGEARADDEIDLATLRAEKLAAEAESRAAQGAYAEAVELYLQATQSSSAAVLAFDVAYLYDHHLGAKSLALDYYKRAVASPDIEPSLARRAKERIAALEAPAEQAQHGPGTPTDTEPRDARSWSAMKTWALVAGGAGVVGLGIGSAFGLVAKSKDDEAGKYCDGDRCTDRRALTLTNEASSAARVADVAFVTGAVLVAGGVTLWLLAPRSTNVRAGVRGSSLVVGGEW